MKRVTLFCNLFWLCFSLAVCVVAFRLRLGTAGKPGSGFFPFGAALVMCLLSLSALISSTRGRMRPEEAAEERAEKGRLRWWNIAIILLAVVAYALTLDAVGFLVDTFLFITVLLKVIEPQTWKTSIIGGAISAVAADVMFNLLFHAQIPSGILGF